MLLVSRGLGPGAESSVRVDVVWSDSSMDVRPFRGRLLLVSVSGVWSARVWLVVSGPGIGVGVPGPGGVGPGGVDCLLLAVALGVDGLSVGGGPGEPLVGGDCHGPVFAVGDHVVVSA